MSMTGKTEKPCFILFTTPGGDPRVEMLSRGGMNWRQEYVEELLEVIRDIRNSEREEYGKIKEIYARCSVDYDPGAEATREFYSTVQNKLLWAVTGQTAAEIISRRADAGKPYMGLKTWKNAPGGKVRKQDAYIAKNYLSAKEVREMERLTSRFLDFAEKEVKRNPSCRMTDWSRKLDLFLEQNNKKILPSTEEKTLYMAEDTAGREYTLFKENENRLLGDKFDQGLRELLQQNRRSRAFPPTP